MNPSVLFPCLTYNAPDILFDRSPQSHQAVALPRVVTQRCANGERMTADSTRRRWDVDRMWMQRFRILCQLPDRTRADISLQEARRCSGAGSVTTSPPSARCLHPSRRSHAAASEILNPRAHQLFSFIYLARPQSRLSQLCTVHRGLTCRATRVFSTPSDPCHTHTLCPTRATSSLPSVPRMRTRRIDT